MGASCSAPCLTFILGMQSKRDPSKEREENKITWEIKWLKIHSVAPSFYFLMVWAKEWENLMPTRALRILLSGSSVLHLPKSRCLLQSGACPWTNLWLGSRWILQKSLPVQQALRPPALDVLEWSWKVREASLKILFKIHLHSQVYEKSWPWPQGSCMVGELGGNK